MSVTDANLHTQALKDKSLGNILTRWLWWVCEPKYTSRPFPGFLAHSYYHYLLAPGQPPLSLQNLAGQADLPPQPPSEEERAE